MTQPFDNRDWDQRQIEQMDAEIEQLKAVIEDLSDHGCAAERMERLKAQGAEIERLNGELLDQTDRRHWLTNENESQRKLIAELKVLLTRAAGALDEEHVSRPREYHPTDCHYCKLVAELRKAV